MVSLDSAFSAYLPSTDVTVPPDYFSHTTTVTPGCGVPSLSTTSPFTICWASAGNEPMTNINAIAKNCFKGFFLIE